MLVLNHKKKSNYYSKANMWKKGQIIISATYSVNTVY